MEVVSITTTPPDRDGIPQLVQKGESNLLDDDDNKRNVTREATVSRAEARPNPHNSASVLELQHDEIGVTARSTISATDHTTVKAKSSTIEDENIITNQCSMRFQDIILSARRRSKSTANANKAILQGVSGIVPAGKITAVMGPSGCGKSSLLKVLAGRVWCKKHGRSHQGLHLLSGQIYMNEQLINPNNDMAIKRTMIAYVEQEVSIPSTCTPREAMYFSARLRLCKTISDAAIDGIVDKMLHRLRLEKCADTIIGSGRMMGGGRLSGGEQKRVQCGIELVTRPRILVCDEGTTGLSSFDALTLVEVLKRASATIVLSIHQPSPLIVRKLDHLILLSSGYLIYDGAMDESLSTFFAARGYAKPPDYNIADWVMNVVQSQSLTQLKSFDFFQKDTLGVGDEAHISTSDETLGTLGDALNTNHAPWEVQSRLLFQREVRQLFRDRGAFLIRIGTTVFFGLLYGLIYFDIGSEDLSNQINVSSTFGAIAVFLVTTISGVAQSSLMDFPRDRRTFLREYATNHYSVLPYFSAHLCFEVILTLLQTFLQVLSSYYLMNLRISFFLFWSINFVLAFGVTSFGVLLGSVVENPNVAIQLMPALVVPQMLFSGFFISIDLIPSFLRWVQYLCALTYAMRLVLFYELRYCDTESCLETLERNGVLELETIWYWTILLAITVCFRAASMIVLRQKANLQ